MFASLELIFHDPHYFSFELGISVNRYEEETENHAWIRKELSIGLLLISIRFNWIFEQQYEEDKE
jgi:hypothetical protein